MVPEQLNDLEALEQLYEGLERRVHHRPFSRFIYASHSEGQALLSHTADEMVFHPMIESKTVSRIGKISGRVAAVGLKHNGVRFKLYIYLESGPLLVVEQGARFTLS